MRSVPMSVSEGCELQQRMLQHFNLVPRSMSSSETVKGYKLKRLPRKTEQALEASDLFLILMDDPIVHDIHTPADAVAEIKYRMGFSWLTWMIARYFITELVKWLWAEYHQSTGSVHSQEPAQGTPQERISNAHPQCHSECTQCAASQGTESLDQVNSELRCCAQDHQAR
jgi:hypothetical protein